MSITARLDREFPIPSCCCDFSKGLAIWNSWLSPEEYFRTSPSECRRYESAPMLTRIKWIATGSVLGLAKTFVFPVWQLVEVVAFPIIALIRNCQGKSAREYLGAWTFALIGLALSVSFYMISAHYMSMNVAAITFMGFISIGITIHVWRACQSPPQRHSADAQRV